MKLTTAQSHELLSRHGCYVKEACDKCNAPIGPVSFTRYGTASIFCSRECRDGHICPDGKCGNTCRDKVGRRSAQSAALPPGVKARCCFNPECLRGEGGVPVSIAHLRAGTRYCSEACKKQAHRGRAAYTALP